MNENENMNITIPIYYNKLPRIFEHVLVKFTEHLDTYIKAEFLEYNNLIGMMIHEDATNKKKVYNWNKEVVLNKPTVARVEEILDKTNIKISLAYFNTKITIEELMLPFILNKKLINNFIKISILNQLNLNELWENIMYPIDEYRKEEELDYNLYDTFIDKLDTVIDLIKQHYELNEKIIETINNIFMLKKKKYITKFNIISKNGIDSTKNILINVFDKCDNIKLIYDSNSNYILESPNDYNDKIEELEIKCKENNIFFKLISSE